MENKIMTAMQAAKKWGVSRRRIDTYCLEGRILGAQLAGNSWIMPADAKKPIDGRSIRRQKSPTAIKPFLKWVGGKGQLLPDIRKHYPANLGENINKYAESFVGGGAVLFDILENYKLDEVYISDVNAELICAYKTIRDAPDELIDRLQIMQKIYHSKEIDAQKEFYYQQRNRFNELKFNAKQNVELSSLLIFLNKTCFNGLYRVNKKGSFNVPMGAYKMPLICDSDNLLNISKALQNTQIVCADYKNAGNFIDEKTFAYFDPPYRPLNSTSNFTSYAHNDFNDDCQRELAEFVHQMHVRGTKVLVSNSDPKNIDINDEFFDTLYRQLQIQRVKAKRMINSKASNRGKISELLISGV